MGSCMSSDSPVVVTTSAGAPIYGRNDPYLSSGASMSSKRWMGWRKKGREEKGKRGGGFFDRKAVLGGGDDMAEELLLIPGRMCMNGASEVACLFTQQGKKGTNQDAMIVWENFTSRADTVFCGVFDGHGPLGHMVARKVRDSLPLKLCNQWKAIVEGQESLQKNDSSSRSMNSEEASFISIDDEWSESVNFAEDEKLPEIYHPLKQSFLKAFKLMDKELKLLPTVDCFCSGTTAVTLVKQGQDLIIGNLGDSRAIMGTRDSDNNLVALQLTVDLKPNLPREAARIEQCKGRVFALQDEPEVARVWLPNSNSPGLAMARAFGDFCLKDYGLISVPDISYRLLTDKDEFIVLATDGIWDALSNKEVVDIVASAPSRVTAARAVVDSAIRAWRLKFPTSKIDDCAAVCLFLSPLPPSSSQAIEAADNEERRGSVDQSAASLEQPNTLHSPNEIIPISENPKLCNAPDHGQSTRRLADCISSTEEEEWSALEGVTRVNSLLNIPRFFSSDKKSNGRRNRL
ncbi:probable protein phosphatase 2C 66 [Phalaenopsis equestris]|uniref:probable protein phosphatase 2C 66 n=1 Tax=Phalaenopsis equestris TaxID=78828 RepID=UPI0009E569B1|nr:probable protein phosphatase 2C 66 [Phalaenopsis equestris]